jgi:MoaA/NifB/PqqE/SkfB family radical SAM enzyme
MIYNYRDIRILHLEISSLCNAECPLCPRNFNGYPLNTDYIEHNMTLAECKKIFVPQFVQQLTEILINGNFGDMVMNPETVDIIQYFKTANPDLKIHISTNGAARSSKFWQDLAELNCEVAFCLDGLEDTHSLYRRNTLYSTVLRNAQTFITAGGQAHWKMIQFDHNRHQIDSARLLSQQLGFVYFNLITSGRDTGPVFDREKKITHILGDYRGSLDFDTLLARQNLPLRLNNVAPPAKQIACKVQKDKSIYVNSLGEIYPCCWLGFNPKTYGNNHQYLRHANQQLQNIIHDNETKQVGLELAMSWFDQVAESWHKPSYEQGQLLICNHQCGVN